MACLLAVACSPDAPGLAPRPNVVLYVVDTLRADSLGAYGNEIVETPALDRFAEDAMLFERAYAPSSWTRASVATLLSGLDPDVHGAEDRLHLLAPEVVLLPELFQASGYATAAIVTNPNIGSFFGFAQGFSEFEELYRRRTAGKRVPSEELVTRSEDVTDRAIAWLETAPRPFFLLLLSVDPHWPYDPPTGFDRYRGDYTGSVRNGVLDMHLPFLTSADHERVRSFYYGEVAYNDVSFGRLLAYLRKSGLYDESAVVFTSDHGEEFWEHGNTWHGSSLYEESIRVPLVIRAPFREPGARRMALPVSLRDVAPTLLELAGLPIPENMSGRALLAAATPNGSGAIYGRLDLEEHSLRSLISHPWKLIVDERTGQREIFDLRLDPGERLELTSGYPDKLAELTAALDERVAENAARRAEIHAEATAQSITERDLPEDERRALQALGYLDPGD